MNIDDIRHVFVIGSGTMGRQIALRCASDGYQVTVYDISPEALQKAAEQLRKDAAEAVEEKWLTADRSAAALSRIRFTNNPQDAANADLVSESVPEDPKVKTKVFAQFAQICPPRTIFTTNTSTLAPSLYASATGRPDRFAAMHFYNVWMARLLDIMPHPGTSHETIELLRVFAKKIGQAPMVFKTEFPGYVGNNFMGAFSGAANRLVLQRGVAFEDVDRAAMGILGMRMGPFGIFDFDALDFILHQMENAAQAGDSLSRAAADWLKREYVDKGLLGKKSGKGFYTYPNPAFKQPGFLDFDKERLRGVADALITPMKEVALKVVNRGIASVEDTDRAVMIFFNMPMGCFGLFDRDGLDSLQRDLQAKAEMTGESEDQAIAGWLKKDFVDKGLLGKKSGRGFYTYPNPAFSRPDFLTGD
ncbi:MAG: 3-hydroxyacyl-CoA dehydrogenase [Hyphomicrobiales bacterium]|nr:MAG: 3-hydroxyacyl-CoA dehydrogenase [Hyphomicrobiales bacterium]